MRDTDDANDPITDEIATTEHQFLTLVERAAVDGAVTDDDRRDMSYRIEMLSAELRACADADDSDADDSGTDADRR